MIFKKILANLFLTKLVYNKIVIKVADMSYADLVLRSSSKFIRFYTVLLDKLKNKCFLETPTKSAEKTSIQKPKKSTEKKVV